MFNLTLVILEKKVFIFLEKESFPNLSELLLESGIKKDCL